MMNTFRKELYSDFFSQDELKKDTVTEKISAIALYRKNTNFSILPKSSTLTLI